MSSSVLEIIQPDDFHHHLRDNEMLSNTVRFAENSFGRIVVMPNLSVPIINLESAIQYRDRIMTECGQRDLNASFQPLMTIYLTDSTPSFDLIEAQKSGFVIGAKLYPAGATTNSQSGVTNVSHLSAVFVVFDHLHHFAHYNCLISISSCFTDNV